MSGFLTPAFLAGLLALAVPVLVHLVRREEPRGRGFPSLMFLRRLPVPTTRRRRLRDRALLALRCLALALLAFAFARPLPDPLAADAAPRLAGRDVVVLLDASYSMSRGGAFERARDAVREVLDGLGSDDRVALVAFDDAPVLHAGFGAPPATVGAALAALGPGPRGTDFDRALVEAGRLLAGSRRARGVVLVSDLQAVGLPAGGRLRLGEGIDLRVVRIEDAGGRNAAVVGVRAHSAAGGRVALAARVRNAGGIDLVDLPVTVAVDGRVVETRSVSLGAGAERVVEFALPARPAHPARVRVSVPLDALAVDDHRDLVLGPERPLAVVLVESPEAPGHGALFLTEALALAAEPAARVRRTAPGDLADALREPADVIVLDDAPVPGGAPARALAARIEAGAGLLVMAGERMRAPGQVLLPATLGATVDRRGAAARIVALAPTHPLWAALGGDLGEVPVHRYRALDALDARAAVLARFDDGAPALVEAPAPAAGAGRALLLGTSLDPRWSGLALQPAFVPFLHAAVRHLAGRVPAPPAYTIGDVVDLARHANGAGGAERLAAHLAAGGGVIVESPAGEQSPGSGAGPHFLVAREPGFHVIHATGGGAPPLPLAVNVDPAESNPGSLDEVSWTARVDRVPDAAPRPAPGADSARGGEDTAWRALLALAALALVAESVLGAWLARRPPARGTVTGALTA